jgi:TNF receptor-associated protein 1
MQSLIGQFGVGFYSAFMVADEVQVYTHSWRSEGEHLCWTSDGAGYTIDEAAGSGRGCRIVMHLKEDAHDFAKEWTMKSVLGEVLELRGLPDHPQWRAREHGGSHLAEEQDEVTEEEYKEFYKFTANAFDDPSYRLPLPGGCSLVINALLFLPEQNMELYGMGQMEAGWACTARRCSSTDKPPKLLPEWMRFVRGVIDSEDLPLNISASPCRTARSCGSSARS